MVSPGEYTMGPPSGRLLVRTGRAGLGSMAGHDLTIEVTNWEGRARVDPGGLVSAEVTVTAEVSSFTVREGTGGAKPLTGADRAEIEGTIQDKILQPRRHPVMTFRSTGIRGTAEALTVEGELTIMGNTRPVTLRADVSGGRHVHGRATIRQTAFGIKPYSAFFGALKVKDEVGIEFDAPLTPVS